MTALAISLALAPAAAGARPGALDPSFGQGGKLVKSFDLEPENWESAPVALGKLPHGVAIVAAGETVLAIKPNGRLATGFGGGRLQVPAPSFGTLRLVDVAATSGDRIVIAGTVVSDFASNPADLRGERLFLARYLADGTLDPSFGFGGTVVTDAGQPPPRAVHSWESDWEAPRLKLNGIAVDAQGRIVLSGRRLDSIPACRNAYLPFTEAFVARLAENGAFEPGFGAGAATVLSGTTEAEPPALTKGGGVYVVGAHDPACYPGAESKLLVRLDAAGQAVLPFLQDSRLLVPRAVDPLPTALAVDDSGRVLLLGVGAPLSPGADDFEEYPPSDVLVRRFLPSGKFDRSFGSGGTTVLGYLGDYFVPGGIAVDAGGRILVVGTTAPPEYGSLLRRARVARLQPNGRLDRRFGRGGAVATRFGAHAEARATRLTIGPHRRVTVAGPVERPSLPGGEGVAIARYLNR